MCFLLGMLHLLTRTLRFGRDAADISGYACDATQKHHPPTPAQLFRVIPQWGPCATLTLSHGEAVLAHISTWLTPVIAKKKWSALFFPSYKQTHCNCWEPWGVYALTWVRNGGSAKCVTLLTPHTHECLKRVTFDLKPKCYILFPPPFTVSTVKCQSVCDLPTGAKHAIQRVLQTFAHQLWVCRETSDMRFLRESLYAVILGDCWLLPCQTFMPHIPNAEKVPTLGSTLDKCLESVLGSVIPWVAQLCGG